MGQGFSLLHLPVLEDEGDGSSAMNEANREKRAGRMDDSEIQKHIHVSGVIRPEEGDGRNKKDGSGQVERG